MSKVLYEWEKKLARVFPGWMQSRADARVKMFRAEAAMISRKREYPVTRAQQNPESSIYSRDRVQLMLDSRDLEENSAVVSAIQIAIQEYGFGKVQYCARTGGGVTADKVYNQFLAEWAKNITLDKRFSLDECMQLGASSSCRDGDIGAIIADGYAGDNGLPRIAPIEADRIGDINSALAYNARYVSGFSLGPNGTIEMVDIYNRHDSGYTKATSCPGNQFLHWRHGTRFDAYRGVSGYRPVLGHIRDVKEIIDAEILAIKWASSIAGVVQRDSGGAVEGEDYFGDGTVAGEAGEKIEHLQPGRVEYLEPNEKFTQFESSRPTPAWQGLIQLVLRLAALGLNIPYSFLFDASGVMGTATRLDSARAQRAFFRHQKRGTTSWLDPLKDLVIAIGIATKQLPPTPNPYSGTFLFSAHPTVDIGRESQANLAENRQGLKTALDIYGEQGKNVFDEQEQLAVEAQHLLELSKRYKVPVSMMQTLATQGRTDADPVQGVHGSDQEQAALDSKLTGAHTTGLALADMDPDYRIVWLEQNLGQAKAGSPLEQYLVHELSKYT